jgi:hypothetical protein
VKNSFGENARLFFGEWAVVFQGAIVAFRLRRFSTLEAS